MKTTKVRIEDRDVYIIEGSKHQTINICTAENSKGIYQQKITLNDKSVFVTAEEVQKRSIDALIEWLVAARQGTVEINLGKTSVEIIDASGRTEVEILEDLPLPIDGKVKPDKEWVEEARQVTEFCINRLVQEFVEFPYLHRVEHSVHARLFELLRSQPPLDQYFALLGGALSQPVHKEWPEPKSRPAKRPPRRGNLDIAILYPSQLRACSTQDFSKGLLNPTIAIELGLNYGICHLRGDAEKMQNSRIAHAYLVHLVRGQSQEAVVSAFLSEKLAETVHIAFAQVNGHRKHIKLLGESVIHEITQM